MAIYHGKSGMIIFSTADIFKMQSWSLTAVSDFIDTTGMEESWREGTDGLEDFTATAEGVVESAADLLALVGTSATTEFEFVTGGADKLVGTAILESITETQDVEDVGRISYSFVGNDSAGLVLTG